MTVQTPIKPETASPTVEFTELLTAWTAHHNLRTSAPVLADLAASRRRLDAARLQVARTTASRLMTAG